jgi:hypothetical protein
MSVVELRDARAAGLALLTAGAAISVTGVHPTLVCPLRVLTGIPCPLCGMTTSVEASLHGDAGVALAANPIGLVAVLAALALPAVRSRRVVVPRGSAIAVLAAMWVFELHRFGVL